jgi:competence protein ComGE
MLRKIEGFFLLELLLSLSAWFMLTLFFIPILTELANQSQQLVREKRANQLLYEELQANLMEDRTNSSYSLSYNGTEYKIYWTQENTLKEVCVKVEGTSLLPKIENCAVPE